MNNTSSDPLKLKITSKSCICEKVKLAYDRIDPGQFTIKDIHVGLFGNLRSTSIDFFGDFRFLKQTGKIKVRGKIL